MNKIIYIFAFVAISLTACQNNEEVINVIPQTNLQNDGLLIRKIKKIINPYSVTNMKKAYESLQAEGLMKTQFNIEATHLYVRFLPKDSADLETLYNDTSLILFSYPLDYELSEGEKYIDSTLTGNEFTWLYTKVPVGYVPPVSGYEVLEELYLPMDVEAGRLQAKQKKISAAAINCWSILEEKSLKLTGNYTENVSAEGKQNARWWPHATIMVKDDTTHTFIPVQGAKVRARWWFNWEDGITDSNGVAKMSGSFSGKLNWSIIWEGTNWDIRDGMFLQAYYNGPDGVSTHWYLNIDGGKSKAYAHVHRACWTMYHGDNMGCCKQYYQLTPDIRQKISVYDHDGNGASGINYGGNWFIFSQINIYMRSVLKYSRSEEIYGTTVHELAHGLHILDMDVDIFSFIFINIMIQESWATAVEWAITNNEYKRFDVDLDHKNSQRWGLLKTDYSKNSYPMNYSPVFIDLIDDDNQRNMYSLKNLNYEFPDDNVTGFTIAELRGVLRKTFNLADLKKNVKALRTDPVILSNIDKLFETYEKAK